MRPLSELIDSKEPAWPTVKKWLDAAKHPVEVLDTPQKRGGEVLHALQITTRSPMGAIAFQTGGLLVDHAWVRVLGGGCSRLEGDLARWNGLGERPLVAPFDGATFVAHDAVGGFYALDRGALGDGKGNAFYFDPALAEWQDLRRGYSELIAFLLMGDLNELYAEYRFEGWEKESEALSADTGWALPERTVLAMPELLLRSL